MKTYRSRPVDPTEEDTFWVRANECYEIALYAADQKKWSACAINAIHAMIALADLMCARFAGKRYAGVSHDEAVSFYAALGLKDDEFNKSVQRLGQALSSKTHAEYDGSALSENQARQILKNAERFRDYVMGKLKRR